MRSNMLLIATAMAIMSIQALAADDLDSLKQRKAELERQLETLKYRIVELDVNPQVGK